MVGNDFTITFFGQSQAERDQELFLCWLFKHASLKEENKIKELAQKLICLCCGFEESCYQRIVIEHTNNVSNQYSINTEQHSKICFDILIRFKFIDKKHILAIEHKHKASIRQSIQDYCDSLESLKSQTHTDTAHLCFLKPLGFNKCDK